MNVQNINCSSCWSETLMDIGIYSSYEKVPRNKIRQARELYENIYYESHEINKYPISNAE